MIPSLTQVCTLYTQWRESDTVCTRIVDPHRVVHQLQSVCVKSERNLHCPLWAGVHLLGESLFPKLPTKKNVSWLVYFIRRHVFSFVLTLFMSWHSTHFFLSMLMDVCVTMWACLSTRWRLGCFHVSISMIPLCAKSKVNESRWSCISMVCCVHTDALQLFNDMNCCSQL